MRRGRSIAIVVALVVAGCSTTTGEELDSSMGCPAPDPADSVEITAERAAAVVGMSEIEATECAASLGWGFRVGRRDEESFLLTADYVASRITVEVEDDRVVTVTVG